MQEWTDRHAIDGRCSGVTRLKGSSYHQDSRGFKTDIFSRWVRKKTWWVFFMAALRRVQPGLLCLLLPPHVPSPLAGSLWVASWSDWQQDVSSGWAHSCRLNLAILCGRMERQHAARTEAPHQIQTANHRPRRRSAFSPTLTQAEHRLSYFSFWDFFCLFVSIDNCFVQNTIRLSLLKLGRTSLQLSFLWCPTVHLPPKQSFVIILILTELQ